MVRQKQKKNERKINYPPEKKGTKKEKEKIDWWRMIKTRIGTMTRERVIKEEKCDIAIRQGRMNK